MVTTELDQTKVDAFAGKLVDILNGAALALMTSIGHQVGLFDTMAALPPSTSEQIAKAGGLNERYVREWLGAMVVGGFVDYDPRGGTYALPPEHAASLTRAAGIGNLATWMQFVALLGDVEEQVADSFRNGGGVPYSAYPKFQQLMAQLSGQTFDATLLEVTLPLVPGLVDRLRAGIDVADVGCGSGHAINLMAREFPSSRFTGYDFSEEGIGAGRAEAKKLGINNARFEIQDAARLGGPPRFDLITTFDAVHDQAEPARMLRGIAEALRPGGTYLCVDVAASSNVEENIEHPLGPMFYTVSALHCMTVSLALGGTGLGAMWGEQKAIEMLHEAGFTSVEVKKVEGDFENNYYVARKG